MLISALLFAFTTRAQSITDPMVFGRDELQKVAGQRLGNIELKLQPSLGKEAYRITPTKKGTLIEGGDRTGAMYGELEFAERLSREPKTAWKAKATGKPYLADRGVNLFLTLPWNYAKNDTDYDIGALTDPNRWWFHNEDYWTTLLDLMAKSRLNWLDIHGSWDISSTRAPNLYAYFVTSPSFPKVGVSDDIKAKNMRQLNHVIEMAHARGIRVSLMCYEANLVIPQNPNPGYQATEANIYKYTAEVVEHMVRGLPKLDAIGFRIGESGHGESFFSCYDEGLKKAGRDIPLVTRSWITRKQKVLPLARASKDFTVEIKYNGEQWGAPYPIMGGRMANWGSYSFEDYFSDSGPGGAKMWPGNVSPEGEKWPAQPYKVVWQVRANGTHRIFPFYNPEWTRRSIKAMKLGTVSGYTVEGLDAYFPKSPDYYLADPKDKYCNWIHQRDEMYWMCWGRLGYDPETPEAVFDTRANKLLGETTNRLVSDWKTASKVIPYAFMAHSLGPDHRNHAPELEWGGDTQGFITGQGFDTHAVIPIQESLANAVTGGIDSRSSPIVLGWLGSMWAGGYIANERKSGMGKEVWKSIQSSQRLAGYYFSRLSSAAYTAQSEAKFGSPRRPDPSIESKLGYPGTETPSGTRMLFEQAADPFFRPFTDRLRMHTNSFTWKSEAGKMSTELEKMRSWPTSKEIFSVTPFVSDADNTAEVKWKRISPSKVEIQVNTLYDRAWVLSKPLPSSTFFHRTLMSFVRKVSKPGREDRSVHAVSLSIDRSGMAFSIEALGKRDKVPVAIPTNIDATPYYIIPAQPGPTPQIYNAEEATRFLKSEKIDPKNYGGMLIGSRAQQFWGSNDRTMKRKLLDPVARGMRLVILQQDFNKYKLDWMPKPLNLEATASDTFDPGNQLGLKPVHVSGVMWQKFAPSEGWEIFGNGGLARLKHGQGEIWVTTARLMQSMHMPESAKAFVRLLSLGGKNKPTILVDSGSEGAEFTSSCHPDLMNSHEIPFLTLGEVVAKEQGMDEYTVIPGPTRDDDVLQGRGEAMVNAFLKKQVQIAAARPLPTTKQELESDKGRRKSILMKSLGLDPMPARTPLNARITGVVHKSGYRIEKLVFESRPKFFVTAHVYVPEPLLMQTQGEGNVGLISTPNPLLMQTQGEGNVGLVSTPNPLLMQAQGGGKYPVIVHVNGHWAHKKAEDRLQLRNAISALNGYITVSLDTPGWSFEGNSLIERRAEGNHNDFKLVEGGSNTTGYYVWDAMRALDYMATRPDTDMDKVGITGASGGGLATLFIFAADDRYKAAVPVVYMSSMEIAPDNGCLCNHVPALNQIGDKSDVLAIQAPKPVFIMGAQVDGEFPSDGMRLTHKKAQQMWSLYGKGADTFVQIYAGGHDYNQPMREQMIGFFDKYLKGVGDGSPVKQTDISIFDPEDRGMLVLDPPLPERTMRDLSKEYLAHAPKEVSAKEAIALNGGYPASGSLNFKEIGTGSRRIITFESEPGLITPGILMLPKGKPKGLKIIASDAGKSAAVKEHGDDYAYLYIDLIGTGELGSLDMRYPIYLGKSLAFIGGGQLRIAAKLLSEQRHLPIEIEGYGPLASQAVMWAGLPPDGPSYTRSFSGYDCLPEWSDVYDDNISDFAVQPRAHLMGSLFHLRSLIPHSGWKLR